MVINGLLVAKALACGFFAILFLQSGIDKVADRKGNIEWLTPHFANSPFKGMVPLLLSILTLMELASGLAAAAAIYFVFTGTNHGIQVGAIALCGITFLALFMGQRLAKDYAGASTIAIYFGVCLVTLYVMSSGYELSLP